MLSNKDNGSGRDQRDLNFLMLPNAPCSYAQHRLRRPKWSEKKATAMTFQRMQSGTHIKQPVKICQNANICCLPGSTPLGRPGVLGFWWNSPCEPLRRPERFTVSTMHQRLFTQQTNYHPSIQKGMDQRTYIEFRLCPSTHKILKASWRPTHLPKLSKNCMSVWTHRTQEVQRQKQERLRHVRKLASLSFSQQQANLSGSRAPRARTVGQTRGNRSLAWEPKNEP